ncbi:MAG: hypothetical protein H6Q07_189 [Acidobacteria bacterium]|nr:hypothetical protein [Acidobacteriota bacterium]
MGATYCLFRIALAFSVLLSFHGSRHQRSGKKPAWVLLDML